MMRVRPLFFSAILGVTLLALALPLRAVVGEIITTNIYLQAPDDVQPEDLYLAATTARVDGTVDGDLVVSAGSVEISGTVTGDVLVLSQGSVEVTGDIGGSLRGIARSIVLEGSVGADLSVVALSTRISGTVARDALVFGGTLEIDGEVGRDVNGRMVTASINGKIGHDLDIAVTTLTLGGDTNVTGDVLYRSSVDAGVASTVRIGGQFQRLPTRGGWAVELVLTLATIIGFLGFLFAGIVLIWLFRRTSPRAVRSVVEHPLRASLVGVGALILIPVLIVVLLMTLVGVPVAIAVLLLYVLLLVFGPIPAVTAIGSKLLRDRWGLFAAFFVGAVMWRLGIWLIPFLGFALYLGALAVGVGGWAIAIWEQRKETPVAADLLPRSRLKETATSIPAPLGWDAPLAPGTRGSDSTEASPADEESLEDGP
ncbi:MAG: polymer-forming cytoskeletal protein [Acidimicrobiia bacterium]